MPNRLVRQEILTSDRVDVLSSDAEVFYRRFMNVVDDYGRFTGDWRVLRAELYPLRADRITRDQVETWLAECTRTLDGQDEPLILVYFVGRKRYLQITNFKQRLRSKSPSKFPAPSPASIKETREEREKGEERENDMSDTTCQHLSAYTGNSTFPPPTPPPSPTSPPDIDFQDIRTHANASAKVETNGLGDSFDDDDDPPTGIDYRQCFEELVEAYPQAGRERLQQAYAAFMKAIAIESKQRQLGQAEVFREMLEGLLRWKASERWEAGKVHLLKTFLAERLWREDPISARSNGRPRAPATKREQGVAEFRRRLIQEVEEANENAGFVHGTGPDPGGR